MLQPELYSFLTINILTAKLNTNAFLLAIVNTQI